MATLETFAHLVARQEDSSGQPTCDTGNEYDGRIGLRIAALFIIWVTSSLGAVFPIFANRHRGLKVPEWVFFICKYFGSGVIIATAFIHLLAPAIDALTDSCLTGPITEYDWAEGIVLMTVFVLFFVELMVMRYGSFGGHPHSHEHEHEHGQGHVNQIELERSTPDTEGTAPVAGTLSPYKDTPTRQHRSASTHVPGEDHMGHVREHSEIEDVANPFNLEDYKAQMTAIFILEFGIIFHSIFIGLTLAVAGDEFNTLFIVIIFHQTFEGLGLGSRLAVTPWPKDRRWTPYLLGLGYGLSTPLSIAIGLGVRKTYPPGSRTTLIVNGVFDSVSAGILIYTGLVELMAHEFMFSNSMRRASIRTVMAAFVTMCLGAGLMALLGKWA
ncbi:hypothetical protein A1O7_01581 [Cladophialophora yegresii CBS 114405]|uniref:Zinc-regulated transporter 2 n=1 Tax=Cladophialophora yegresii CBS 114405 TaxID=1182544 RepID=W9WJS2_9EURO|nr:uncharacterized protein A1O7_01581 [Cladophialophora yegresii CBS 114405]EXJ65240.1 hypothetical protein A1O7_01581 [Cladophialophora yegresii CBS 114405]